MRLWGFGSGVVVAGPGTGEIVSALTNLGLGGLMAAALVWFLHHVVTRTLPEMNRVFREEVAAERDARRRENEALLEMMDRLSREQHAEHEALMRQLDAVLNEQSRALAEFHTALQRIQDVWTAGGPRPRPRPGQP
jgi:hypothetical protein